MNAAQVLFTAVIYGITLRVVGFAGKTWLAAEDLSKVLEHRTADTVTKAFSRHRAALEVHSSKAKIDGDGHDVRLFDEIAVRHFCEHAKRPGATALWRWLNDGGMTANGPRHPEPAPASAANVVAFKSPCVTPPASQAERQKAYCRELLKTLLRYATEEEAEELTHAIETEVADLLNRRHCPGLNDARYDVYRRFWLQGGAV